MRVKTGLQVFLESGSVMGERVGLVSHPAAVLPDLSAALDALQACGVQVAALFGPEHGYWGFEADAQRIAHSVDPHSGLPAYSLYGDHMDPAPEMLAQVDALIFDMQDVGVRFYTFISTLYYVLKAAGKQGKRVIVLDRPNPLGGDRMAGPLLEEEYRSFVGIARLPALHGLTMGEMARWMNARCGIGAQLEVIAMQGWERWMRFEDTGLPWVPTSPGMPHLSTAWIYPCTCLVEGTNLSEGRGTPLPFELVGAPWVDQHGMAAALNGSGLTGVRFRPALFRPADNKWAGQVCAGVQLHLTDPREFEPLLAGLTLVQWLHRACEQFVFLESSWEGTRPHFDLLMGTGTVRSLLVKGTPPAEIAAGWKEGLADFEAERRDYLLYA